MMSSSTEPSASSQRCVYCARPGPDLGEVVGERGLQAVERVVALDPHRAEVADVEGDGPSPAGQVLGHGAGRVG